MFELKKKNKVWYVKKRKKYFMRCKMRRNVDIMLYACLINFRIEQNKDICLMPVPNIL